MKSVANRGLASNCFSFLFFNLKLLEIELHSLLNQHQLEMDKVQQPQI